MRAHTTNMKLRSKGHLGSVTEEISSPTVTKRIPVTSTRLRLLEWTDLPGWQQDYISYIERGYRPVSGSVLECYKSWAYLHNESVNIYSHIAGAFLFAALPFYVFKTEVPPRYEVATPMDLTLCTLYFFGVSICFVLSVTFHTIICHSSRLFNIGIQLDFQGIVLLMWSATVPLIYYGFYCDPTLRTIYWISLSCLAMACSVLIYQRLFRTPQLRRLRVVTFGSFAVSSIIPLVHAISKYGWELQVKRMGLKWVILTLVFNAIGATAYALDFPEKSWRRKFDYFGGSHQILHVTVVCAALAFTVGLLQAFDFLHEHGDTCGDNV